MGNRAIDQIQNKIIELLKSKGLENLQNPVTQLIKQSLQNMEFVTLEEFDVQREVLNRLREKVSALETRIAALENKSPQ